MKLTATALALLQQLAGGEKKLMSVATALHLSQNQTSRVTASLQQKGLVQRQRSQLLLTKTPLTNLLVRLISTYPNLIPLLSSSGLPILTSLLTPKTSLEAVQETGFQKSAVYRKIQEAEKASVLREEGKRYAINSALWPELTAFLQELKTVEETVEPCLPPDVRIYHKTRQETVFSTAQPVTATKTAFSAYVKYGIKLLLPRDYYVLPSRKLTKKDIFRHSLFVTQHEKTVYNLLYLAVFFCKFRKSLSKINYPLLVQLKEVLDGKAIPGFPSPQEIKEKLEVYS